MSKITPIMRYGSALSLFFVLLTVSALAQTATPTTENTTTPPPATAGTGTPAAPAPGMQPGPMGGMTGMGAMPPGMGMYATPSNMMPGMGGADPEVQAFLNRRLQNLRMAETQMNNDIAMAGGEASPAARQLIMQRTQLQGNIRELEQQLGVSSPGATAANPMAGMQPDMPGAGMPPGFANPYDMTGMPNGMGTMGATPDNMMLDALRQEAVYNLRDVQRTLSYLAPNDPVREQLQSEQARLVEQIESLNKQMGQPNSNAGTPGAATNVPGSNNSLASSILAQQQQQESARQMAAQQAAVGGGNASFDPRLQQMREAERQLRAMGEIAAADMLLKQIEEQTNNRFAEPPLPGNMTPPMPPLDNAMMGGPALPIMGQRPAQPTTTDIVRQAEILELRNTVESLRDEISSMREEIRALETLLRQFNPSPSVMPNNMDELQPAVVN